MDDHISKLEHMGKETVKKLQDIRGSAVAVGMDINVPDNTINKGGWAGGRVFVFWLGAMGWWLSACPTAPSTRVGGWRTGVA